MPARKIPDPAAEPTLRERHALRRAAAAVAALLGQTAPGGRVYRHAPQRAAEVNRCGKRLLAALHDYRLAGGGHRTAA